MPRYGRLHLPGGYYHVMGRGLERRRIFAGSGDKQDFLERLGVGLEETHSQCLAFAMMSNHYHLLIRVSSAGNNRTTIGVREQLFLIFGSANIDQTPLRIDL